MIYDKDGDGRISYKEFCAGIFGYEIGGSKSAKDKSNSPE